MGGKIRKTGIDALGDAPWGSHFCQFYQTKKDLIDILVPYFKAGLENNEFCMWVTSEPLSEKEAKKAMREALPDFDRYLKRGQIEIVPHEELYLKEGAFNLQRVLNAWIDKHDRALAKGYDGIRFTGNTAWLEERDWRNFIEYKAKLNKVIGKYKMLAICSYLLDKCGTSEVIDVVANHQFALIRREGKWELIESSERKKAEQELEASKRQLQGIIDNFPSAISVKDAKGRYILINQEFEKNFGINSNEIIGKTDFDLLRKEMAEKYWKEDQEVIKTGKSIEREDQIAWKGEIRHFILTKFPLLDSGGQPYAVCVLSTDISDRKWAEEERERILHRIKERYKDLNCLYGIDKISRREGVTIEQFLKEVAQLMPPAWQYPEITGGCITYEDKKYKTRKFKETKWMQRADIIVNNKKAGLVEVCYLEKKPEIDEGPFVEEERNLINAISERLGQIIERKRAEDDLKSSQTQLRNLAAHLQSAREEERMLIAREIHDELGQSLTALKMDLFWLDKRMPVDQKPLLKKTKSMSKLIDKTVQRIKKISAELRPGLLDYLGLPAAIEWEGEEFQNRTGTKCEVNIDSGDIILDQDRSTALFRIFQEALTNTARHANATRVKVSLKEKAGNLELRVRDNGKGITEKQISNPKSFGLIGMRERAHFLGGEVKIRGVQGKGTTVRARIPLPQQGKN